MGVLSKAVGISLLLYILFVINSIVVYAADCGGDIMCSCGDTLVLDHLMSYDLNCTGNGIIFGAENIVLDCNGHIINGDHSGVDNGVQSNGLNNVTIKNCIVTNFESGILLQSSNSSSINNNTVISNRYGVNHWGGFSYKSTTTNNKAINNRVGFRFAGSHNNSVILNIANSNEKVGFEFYVSDNNTVTNNIANSNTIDGIFLYLSSFSRLNNNIVSFNNHDGILIANSNVNNLTNNTINNNFYKGLNIRDGSNANLIATNTLCSNNQSGTNSYDLYNFPGLQNFGSQNTCQTSFNWNDAGSNGCRFLCIYSNMTIVTNPTFSSILGRYFSLIFEARGGSLPYTWSLINGTLPAGIDFNSEGLYNGTPIEGGNFTFTIRAIDANGSTAEKTITHQIYVTLPPARIEIQKVGTTAVPGRILDYFIILTNVDVFPAEYIEINEFLDAVTFELISTNPSAFVLINETSEEPLWFISWNLSLNPGETKILSYRALLNTSTPIGTEVIGPVCFNIPNPPPQGGPMPDWRPLPMPAGGYRIGCTGGFGCWRPGGSHKAVDIQAPEGTPVYSIAPGVVVFSGWYNNDHGTTIIIRHGQSEYSFYSHLSVILVVENQNVAVNQHIGFTGTTGLGGFLGESIPCMGPHLHFSYRIGSIDDSSSVNPCFGLTLANPERCSCRGGACSSHNQNTTAPQDPNEKIVIAEKFIQTNQILLYPIHFENIGNTSAQDIFVTDVLSENTNTSTLEILAVNGTFITISEGQTLTIFERDKNITIGQGNVTFNITVKEIWNVTLNQRILRWNLTNIYLEPNQTGEVLFSTKPLQSLPSGTEIRNNATIQFEIFEPIVTNDTLNIIDDVIPQATMNPLPNRTINRSFILSWNGTDAVGEINSYTIFVSVNDEGYNVLTQTNETFFNFSAVPGTFYKFIAIAEDTAGNVEVQEPVAEAEILVMNRRGIGSPLFLKAIPRVFEQEG